MLKRHSALQTPPRPLLRALTTCLAMVWLGSIGLKTPPGMGQQLTGLHIQGKVKTSDSGPLPMDVKVVLERAEGVFVTQQFVGNQGKFEFDNLSEETFRVIVTAKGYQTVVQVVDMHYLASRFPSIYLTPEAKKDTGPKPANTVSATDLAAPKKAVKEYQKGHVALQSEKYDEALEHLDKAIAEYPCYARAYSTRGVTLSMQHQFSSAETSLRKAISCDAGYLEAYLQLGMLLNLENKFGDSETTLQAGLQHFPAEWQLYYQLGISERGLKQFDKAEAAYLKAESITPEVPAEFHAKLADVFLREKKYDKAYSEMQAYLRAAPIGEYAEETKGLMKRLETSGLVTTAQDQPGKANPPQQ